MKTVINEITITCPYCQCTSTINIHAHVKESEYEKVCKELGEELQALQAIANKATIAAKNFEKSFKNS